MSANSFLGDTSNIDCCQSLEKRHQKQFPKWNHRDLCMSPLHFSEKGAPLGKKEIRDNFPRCLKNAMQTVLQIQQ